MWSCESAAKVAYGLLVRTLYGYLGRLWTKQVRILPDPLVFNSIGGHYAKESDARIDVGNAGVDGWWSYR